jgi:hypothetical protein
MRRIHLSQAVETAKKRSGEKRSAEKRQTLEPGGSLIRLEEIAGSFIADRFLLAAFSLATLPAGFYDVGVR